jgi:hypothetical protein
MTPPLPDHSPAGTEAEAYLLDRFLDARPHHPCPSCAHPLNSPLPGARCPACREPLVVRIGLVEPMTGSLIAGASGLGAALGFSGILAVYFTVVALFEGFPMREFWRFALPMWLGAMVSGAVLALLISRRGRTWIRTRRAITRRVLVIVCLALPLVLLAGLIAAAP